MWRWIMWISWGVEAVAAVLCAVGAPIVAIVLFVTGNTHEGWIAVACFVGAVLYGLLLAYEVIDPPWRRD